MPSGFTEGVQTGEVTTLPEFAINCAHAFFYDMSIDTPLLEAVEARATSSDYHARALAEAEQKLAEASSWTEEEATEAANRYNQEGLKDYLENVRENRQTARRYGAMLLQVEAWEPPTEDHHGLKKYMVEQLETSIEHDICRMERPEKVDGPTLREREIESAQRAIDRHTEKVGEEKTGQEKQINWVRDLEASLDNWQPVE